MHVAQRSNVALELVAQSGGDGPVAAAGLDGAANRIAGAVAVADMRERQVSFGAPAQRVAVAERHLPRVPVRSGLVVLPHDGCHPDVQVRRFRQAQQQVRTVHAAARRRHVP